MPAALRSLPGRGPLDRTLARLAPAVLGWCRRLGGDIDVQDAAQEVLAIFFHKADTLADLEAIEPWAFAVTRNVVRRHRRRRWWVRWVGPPDEAHASEVPDPENRLGSRQIARLVDRVLDSLPEEQREVIV